jgi:hypothetical protein
MYSTARWRGSHLRHPLTERRTLPYPVFRELALVQLRGRISRVNDMYAYARVLVRGDAFALVDDPQSSNAGS